ncbi:MAG TPA: hypothetical protein VHQ64_02035 [Pyrinomonadaceae bacterium]|nr:hypothetical protein [Pyrinomonadaceae bacterium]
MRTTDQLLDTLETAKRDFDLPQAKINALLSRLEKAQIGDAAGLIRLHESLLFMRAYPRGRAHLKRVERMLKNFGTLVAELVENDLDLSAIDDPEVSGIAGGSVTSNFSYAIVRWLVEKFPAQLSIDWDWFEEEDRFGATTARFMPLLEDDAMVEAHVPYREWVRAAKGRRRELNWLVSRFESLPLPEKAKANLYDSLKLHVTWTYGLRSSRTGLRIASAKPFMHNSPLIARRDISLTEELSSGPIPIETVSPSQGEKIIDVARETSAVRYRELHGFTFGDARRVIKADIGRGTVVYVVGVPPPNRLPLRAYHAAMMFKNGVPVGYFEGLSICERMESGFNLYYTFRDGETAWLYARILRLMRQLLGVSVFSIDPYQVGHENEEGIESGAFWFYRKLGFRPVKPELMKLTEREEARAAKGSGYRTSAATLRKLAAGHMLFELSPQKARGCWDDFEVRNLGLAVQRRMAEKYESDGEEIRNQSAQAVTRALRINTRDWNEEELSALRNLSLVLASGRDLNSWPAEQKELAARVIRAKAGRDEALYLKLMQKHAAFRDVLMRLGCR